MRRRPISVLIIMLINACLSLVLPPVLFSQSKRLKVVQENVDTNTNCKTRTHDRNSQLMPKLINSAFPGYGFHYTIAYNISVDPLCALSFQFKVI